MDSFAAGLLVGAGAGIVIGALATLLAIVTDRRGDDAL